MEKTVYTADELNNASRDDLVGIILSLQENIAGMMENRELILEQIARSLVILIRVVLI